jgi:EAL domain-containing protein (putative c-di-GMP-specific phosphodiesterase class I)
VQFATGALAGVEALVRWRHPVLGTIPPDRFIPLAEQSGLINHLTRWVLGEALRQSAVWHERGYDLRIAINLSARSLHSPELIDFVLDRVTAADVAPERLALEITESAVMTDELRAGQMLRRLHDRGVEISIDDFGTGYSSLTNLRRLPVSEIKIDKSFVSSVPEVDEDRIIVSSIIELGHNLGLQVVAEGVETLAAWHTLAGFGCDTGQGYFLSRPLGANDLERFMNDFVAPPRAPAHALHS